MEGVRPAFAGRIGLSAFFGGSLGNGEEAQPDRARKRAVGYEDLVGGSKPVAVHSLLRVFANDVPELSARGPHLPLPQKRYIKPPLAVSRERPEEERMLW